MSNDIELFGVVVPIERAESKYTFRAVIILSFVRKFSDEFFALTIIIAM